MKQQILCAFEQFRWYFISYFIIVVYVTYTTYTATNIRKYKIKYYFINKEFKLTFENVTYIFLPCMYPDMINLLILGLTYIRNSTKKNNSKDDYWLQKVSTIVLHPHNNQKKKKNLTKKDKNNKICRKVILEKVR